MTVSLPQFAGTQVVGFVLVLCRVGGLFAFAPIFSGRMIPTQAKLIIAGAISFTLMPLVTAGGFPMGIEVVPLMLKEVVVGLAFALALGVVFAAVQFGASLLDTLIGFSFAALVDPIDQTPSAILGQFYSMFAVVVFLVIGGDQLMIEGFAVSYRLIPLGRMPSVAQLGSLATNDLAQIAIVGLEIGAPVVIALVVVDVAFALVARTVPQMNVFVVGLPAKIMAGLAAIAASLAFVSGDLQNLLQNAVMTALQALKVS